MMNSRISARERSMSSSSDYISHPCERSTPVGAAQTAYRVFNGVSETLKMTGVLNPIGFVVNERGLILVHHGPTKPTPESLGGWVARIRARAEEDGADIAGVMIRGKFRGKDVVFIVVDSVAGHFQWMAEVVKDGATCLTLVGRLEATSPVKVLLEKYGRLRRIHWLN